MTIKFLSQRYDLSFRDVSAINQLNGMVSIAFKFC